MNLDKFVEDALVTEADPCDALERLKDIKVIRLLHAAMGLSTEANEFLDVLKKYIFYGKPIDEVNLKEELGDGNWYEAIALDAMGEKFEFVLATVIAKLRVRYPDAFTKAGAIYRNLEAERKVLE
jgi:hypothetical protein